MSNIKIFRANRGEGKTKWLFDRAVEAKMNGHNLYYVGSDNMMMDITFMWENNLHEKCPITPFKYGMTCKAPCSFFTDEMMMNLKTVGDWSDAIKSHGANWYITMSKEDFVD